MVVSAVGRGGGVPCSVVSGVLCWSWKLGGVDNSTWSAVK